MFRSEEDHYVQSAEMYDILSEYHWSSRRESVTALMQGFLPEAKVVVDVGAGTGKGLALVAKALPNVRIHAIEPSASMRVGLMTRILEDSDLRHRVDVYPTDFQKAPLPSSADIVLICGCIGYFDKIERKELFGRVASCLAPGGIALIDVMPIQQPQVIPETKLVSAAVGSHRFDIFMTGNPVEGTDMIRWRMRFEQSADESLIRRFEIERDWRTFSLTSLLEEAEVAGFRHNLVDDSPVPAAILRL